MRRLLAILFSAFFYPVLAFYTVGAVIVFSLFMVVTAPFFSHIKNMQRFRLLISLYGSVIVHVLARPLVSVIFHAAPRDTRVAKIFVANHVAASDPFLMAYVPEVLVQVVNTWPFKLPVWGIFAQWSGYLNVKQMDPELFIEASARLLHEGTSLVVFPEGTRAGEGPVGPFHGSIFRVALATHVPIVPMCIYGNARSPAKGSLVLEPATVRVHCLPEVTVEVYQGMTPFQLKNHVREMICQELERMKRM